MNLVICQDHRYHMLLHVRARVIRAGGNPNTQRLCSTCRRMLLIAEFNRFRAYSPDGYQRQCRACQREYQKHYTRPSERVS